MHVFTLSSLYFVLTSTSFFLYFWCGVMKREVLELCLFSLYGHLEFFLVREVDKSSCDWARFIQLAPPVSMDITNLLSNPKCSLNNAGILINRFSQSSSTRLWMGMLCFISLNLRSMMSFLFCVTFRSRLMKMDFRIWTLSRRWDFLLVRSLTHWYYHHNFSARHVIISWKPSCLYKSSWICTTFLVLVREAANEL